MTKENSFSRGYWAIRLRLLLGYVAPLLVLGLLCLPPELKFDRLFLRNWLRAGCGPVVFVMKRSGLSPNDLNTYAVAFSIIWSFWIFVLLCFPFKNPSVRLHTALGIFWSLCGFIMTAAI